MTRKKSAARLVVVPNYAVHGRRGGYALPCSDKTFLTELSEKVTAVDVAAFVKGAESSFADCKLNNDERITLIPLSGTGKDHSIFLKIGNYLNAFIKGLFVIRKTNNYYIYFPGHVGVIWALICSLVNAPYGLYIRGEWNETNRLWRAIYRILFVNAKYILTTGKAFSSLVGNFNSQVGEVAPMMKFDAGDLSAKSFYALTSDINLLFVSRIEPTKGIAQLVSAVAELQHRGINLCLSIIGGGESEYKFQLEELIESCGLSDCVSIAGHVKEKEKLKRLFRNADLFVYPSYYNEGFPRVLYEAMTFGLPIICTPLVGILGTMKDRENCLFVKKRDVADLCDKILVLINDGELRERIGRHGFSEIEKLHKQLNGATHAMQVIERIEGQV